MHEYGIVFLHHQTDPVTNQNLSLIKRHNPKAPIVTISGGESFPGGYSVETLGEMGGRWKALQQIDPENLKMPHARIYSDLLLYAWYLQKSINCKRWIIFEWDVCCQIGAPDYFEKVWNSDLACANYFTSWKRFKMPTKDKKNFYRSDEWYWFREIDKIPSKMSRHACGVMPFGVLLVSDATLRDVSVMCEEMKIFNLQNEFRIATFAHALGYRIATIPKGKKTLRWKPDFEEDEIRGGKPSGIRLNHSSRELLKAKLDDEA